MEMSQLYEYQNAADIIVQLVYAVAVIAILGAATAGLWIIFGKRTDNSRNADGEQNNDD